jgi:heme o synthase
MHAPGTEYSFSVKHYLSAFVSMTKPIISLAVAFSAFTAYVLQQGKLTSGMIPLYFGVLLTAAGSSALNQIQEASRDQLMLRTRNRPIPAGKLTIGQAAVYTLVLIITGVTVLYSFFGLGASFLALLTILWYNGIYTSFKRLTPWAIIPGAVVGAIPPVIGWVAASGGIGDREIIFLSFFFFIGQIPHFWLILLRYNDDYVRAGFPSISKSFSRNQISRLTFTWTLATAITAISLTVFGIIISALFTILTWIFSVILMLFFIQLLKNESYINKSFMVMNVYFLCMMLFIIFDSLLFS